MIEIEIAPELLYQILTTGNEVHAKIVDGLPDGAVLLDAYWSLVRNGNVRLTMRFDDQRPDEKKDIIVKDLRGEVDELRELKRRAKA